MGQANYFEHKAIQDVLDDMYPFSTELSPIQREDDGEIIKAVLAHVLFPKYLSSRQFEFGNYANLSLLVDLIIEDVERMHSAFEAKHFQAALLISSRMPRE